jgi:hypothetical protein
MTKSWIENSKRVNDFFFRQLLSSLKEYCLNIFKFTKNLNTDSDDDDLFKYKSYTDAKYFDDIESSLSNEQKLNPVNLIDRQDENDCKYLIIFHLHLKYHFYYLGV